MKITLQPVGDHNKDAVLALSVREDQPFVAPNAVSLKQAAEQNQEYPGTARPFAICADDKIVGFCLLSLCPEDEDDDKYWLWRFMIDKNEQGKGYGRAALTEIVRYFRENGADKLYLFTEPENTVGLHLYHDFGFKETGEIEDGEALLIKVL